MRGWGVLSQGTRALQSLRRYMYLRIECAAGNSPPSNKNKKRTAHYARDEYLKGQVQNSGRVDSFTHRENNKFYYVVTREDKGDREGIPHTHPIPQVIRLELFLESG